MLNWGQGGSHRVVRSLSLLLRPFQGWFATINLPTKFEVFLHPLWRH